MNATTPNTGTTGANNLLKCLLGLFEFSFEHVAAVSEVAHGVDVKRILALAHCAHPVLNLCVCVCVCVCVCECVCASVCVCECVVVVVVLPDF